MSIFQLITHVLFPITFWQLDFMYIPEHIASLLYMCSFSYFLKQVKYDIKNENISIGFDVNL